MRWALDKLAYGAMKGFGLGLILSVLISVSTAQSQPLTSQTILQNAFVLVFTLLGLGLGFEDAEMQGTSGSQSEPHKMDTSP